MQSTSSEMAKNSQFIESVRGYVLLSSSTLQVISSFSQSSPIAILQGVNSGSQHLQNVHIKRFYYPRTTIVKYSSSDQSRHSIVNRAKI